MRHFHSVVLHLPLAGIGNEWVVGLVGRRWASFPSRVPRLLEVLARTGIEPDDASKDDDGFNQKTFVRVDSSSNVVGWNRTVESLGGVLTTPIAVFQAIQNLDCVDDVDEWMKKMVDGR